MSCFYCELFISFQAAAEETTEASESVTPAVKRKFEDDKDAESSELESPHKKRKLEASDGSPVAKRVKTDTKESTPAQEDSTEDDFVVVNKEDVPPPDSKEVILFLFPAIFCFVFINHHIHVSSH